MELLRKYDLADVHYPLNQTCCGQPMANSGFSALTKGCNQNFIENFKDFDYIVCPSGSCVLHIKEHLEGTPLGNGEENAQTQIAAHIKENIFELSEFLTDILKVKDINTSFNHRVGFHNSCHGQRMLGLSSMSEKMEKPFSKPISLLKQVKGLELVELNRTDECCGFGGTFCVTEEAVSVKMGKDRITDHISQNVEYITGCDMSCLMHLEGILKRQKNNHIKVIHIAEILLGEMSPNDNPHSTL